MALAQWHGERREINAAGHKARIVFKSVVTEPRVEGNGADGFAPDADFDRLNGFVHGLFPARLALPGCALALWFGF